VLAQSLNSTAPGDHVTTPPRGDLARQVLTLAQDLAVLARRLDDLGDTAALRAQVTGLARRVAKLGEADPGAITELATAVHGLTGRIAALEDALSQHGPSDLWDFTGLPGSFDGDARLQAWEQLREWVRDVLGGVYQLAAASGAAAPLPSGQAGHKIPPCWAQHPDLVAELAWLAQEWIRLYRTPYGTPSRAGDWHDRYLPGLRRRLSASTAMPCIRKGQHVTSEGSGVRRPPAERTSG
jgi:hypothetical protein